MLKKIFFISLVLFFVSQVRFASAEEPTVVIEKVDIMDLKMATDDAIQGKPFVLETTEAGAGWHWGIEQKRNENPLCLTDAQNATAPTENAYFQVKEKIEIVLRWDLGSVLPEGRQLKEIRVWWGLGDKSRSGVNLKFAIHDGATGAWRDVTPYLFEPKIYPALSNTFKVMKITFPDKAVVNFDAIRMCDGSQLRENIYPARFIEVDVFTAPVKLDL